MRLSIARRNLGLDLVVEVVRQVETQVSSGDAGMVSKLDSIPDDPSSLDTSKTYLIPNGSDGPDKYTEYRVIDGQLEPIGGGASSIDLQDYVKKSDFEDKYNRIKAILDSNLESRVETLENTVKDVVYKTDISVEGELLVLIPED